MFRVAHSISLRGQMMSTKFVASEIEKVRLVCRNCGVAIESPVSRLTDLLTKLLSSGSSDLECIACKAPFRIVSQNDAAGVNAVNNWLKQWAQARDALSQNNVQVRLEVISPLD